MHTGSGLPRFSHVMGIPRSLACILTGTPTRRFHNSLWSRKKTPPGASQTCTRYASFWKHSSSPRPDPREFQEAAITERIRMMKARQPTDLMLRCTVFDAEGKVKVTSGQFKKSDLCAEHRLNPRDLRKIDSRVPNLVPTILIRKDAILINILHIRALIKAETVVLFDTYGSVNSQVHSGFLYNIEHNLKLTGSGLPYEFRAIESVFLSVVSVLEDDLIFIRDLVGGLLAELEDNIDHDRFKRLLHYSRRLTSFQNRARLVEKALDEVLEQDEDLTAMYLTDKKNDISRAVEEHDELEVLLESFSKQVEEIVNEADNIESNVQSTQEIVELILDSNRNSLLALDLQVSIVTMGLGAGALIAGLFGMNLTSSLEHAPHAFIGVSGFAGTLVLFITFSALRKLSLIRKMGLSGSHPREGPSKAWTAPPLHNVHDRRSARYHKQDSPL